LIDGLTSSLTLTVTLTLPLLLLPLLPFAAADVCCCCCCFSSRQGYNTTLSRDVVFTMESTLANVSHMLEQLAMDMFSVRTVTCTINYQGPMANSAAQLKTSVSACCLPSC